MYEVSTRHAKRPVDDYVEAAAKMVMQIHFTPKAEGDVLIFMPGSEEIENCCETLRRAAKEFKETDMSVSEGSCYFSLTDTRSRYYLSTPVCLKVRRSRSFRRKRRIPDESS